MKKAYVVIPKKVGDQDVMVPHVVVEGVGVKSLIAKTPGLDCPRNRWGRYSQAAMLAGEISFGG